MKTTIEHNGKTVEIELTKKQIAFVKSQTFDFRTITSFKKACEYQGINEDEFFKQNSHEPKDVLAYKMLRIIAYAINGGKLLKYCEDRVYEVYLRLKRDENGKIAGFACVDANSVPAFTYATLGSRLCFFSREAAEHAGKYFLQVFMDQLTGGQDEI